MNSIDINTSSKSYPIYFTESFAGLYQAIEAIDKMYSSYIIVTDSNVEPLYAKEVASVLSPFDKPIHVTSFEAGEASKTLSTIEGFYKEMIDFGADRKSLVVALGGGVAGDMAGFTAATYMRGIDFVQVPTTLLSQVDSSVGGKTGVDFHGYKNLIGAFYQPEFVFINVKSLHTLPERELYAGMGEVIKHSIIRDKTYFDYLQEHVEEILELDGKTMMETIKWSCEIKKSVVDQDETEQGLRALLNFGHTFGHSIERLKGFDLIHGECVAIGMHGALILANSIGLIDDAQKEKCLDLIQAYRLPITVNGITARDVYQDMFKDKKTTNKRLVFALIDNIGDSRLSTVSFDEELLLQCITEIIN